MSDIRRAWIETGHNLGWSFTPLNGKTPTLKRWQKRPRPDLDQVLAWAAAGNIGLRTGAASGIVVIDIDPGADLDQLAGELPLTVEAKTGRGGRHLYYKHNGPCSNSVSKLTPHVDVRGDGGQVVFPGSIHPETGAMYTWKFAPDEFATVPLPGWIIEVQASTATPTPAPTQTTQTAAPVDPAKISRYAQRALKFEVAAVSRSTEGTRNDMLNRAAFNLGQLVGGGCLDRATVESELILAAGVAGLGEHETRATVQSGLDAGSQSPRQPKTPTGRTAGAQGERGKAGRTNGPPAPSDAPQGHDGGTTATPGGDAVLVPGPQVDADGVYHEISSLDFATAALARLPAGAIYRKGHIPGEILGEPGKRKFVELSSDAGRLLVDGSMRLGQWVAVKKHGSPEDPDHALVYKPCSRDHSSLLIAASRNSDRVPELSLLVNYPAYGPGFELLTPGWHDGANGGLFYDEPPELKGLEPERDIKIIRDTLEELVVDFPFQGEASRQNFFGMLLTPIVAPAIEGNRPMHLLLSPLERTGKTKLAEEVFGGTILGRPTPALQISGHDEERDKRILALLLLGETLIHLDNLPTKISSATLASLLTATTYQGRLLGASRMVSLANALTVVGSGNNPECSGEIAKRSVPILLEPKTAHPEMRVDFQHANLREYVRANRRNILAALLGMVEMWKANKRPMCPIRMGGFEAWSGAVGGIMRACGFTLWRSNAFAWARGADPRGEEIAVFVQAWADMHGTRKCTATELMRTAEATEMFTDEFERKSARGRATVMGSILRKIVNRPVDIWAVRRLESSKPPTMYYLERLPGQAKSGDSESEDTEY